MSFSRVFAALMVLLLAGGPLWVAVTGPPMRLLNWVLTIMCWIAAAIIAYYDVYKGGAKP